MEVKQRWFLIFSSEKGHENIKSVLQKQLSFLITMIFRSPSWTFAGQIVTLVGRMMVRQMKPTKVDSTLTKKLRSSNFIEKFDLGPQQMEKPIQSVAKVAKEQKKLQINQSNNQFKDDSSKKTYNQQIQSSKEFKKARKSKKESNNVELIQRNQSEKAIQKQQPKPALQKALTTLGKALESINPKQIGKFGIQQAAIHQNKQMQQAIRQMRSLELKDFSILIHKLLVNSVGINNTTQKYIWKEIQQDFLTRFEPTTNPVKIRSYAKVIYCLAKSKAHRDNSSTLVSTSISTNLQSFETKFAILLSSATHQSFSMIVTSLSRMGPLSQQFCYIAERLYYSKYAEFNSRERVQINYALTRNGKNADSKLIDHIDSMNLKQILIMLRCYHNCGQLTNKILQIAQKNIIPRKQQMNIVDIGDICSLYFQAMCQDYRISPELEGVLTEMYFLLKKNMNEVAFQKIWKDLPTVVNKGFLQVSFVEQIIKTIKILRKKQEFPERIWKPMRQNFKEFQNLQIRTKLEEIK